MCRPSRKNGRDNTHFAFVVCRVVTRKETTAALCVPFGQQAARSYDDEECETIHIIIVIICIRTRARAPRRRRRRRCRRASICGCDPLCV